MPVYKVFCTSFPFSSYRVIEQDPDDNEFVDCAIVAGADYIVSEDAHFRVLEKIPFPKVKVILLNQFIPNRSLDIGEIACLCHAACFSASRRRSGLRRGVARSRMRTEAGKMPESLIFPIGNGHGVSNDRFGFMEDIAGIKP